MYGELDIPDVPRMDAVHFGRRPVSSGPRLTPPRLRAVAAAEATHMLPTLDVADVSIPASMVRRRADAHAKAARSTGAPHSMRLWREGHQRALLELTCEAAGIPAGAVCETLRWVEQDAEYHVSATFRCAAH
ncbi:MAG TPA: hypothetical protein VFU88_22140 [Ktedonobacterales bacterium]|nr:hypothetical protein [Ktedonobacterales bacterium]